MHTSNIATVQERRYTNRMSVALGAYLKTLREGRGYRPAEMLALLSARMGKPIDQTRLWRVESGKGWPEGDFLTALLDLLHAGLDDAAWFQRTPEATAEDGAARARERLSADERRVIDPLLTTDENRLRLLRAVAELSDDPELRGRIQGYIDALQRDSQ